MGTRRQLEHLKENRLLSTLDDPVDEYLNTPLHVAVTVRCASIVHELICYGAKPYLHNLRGDTPSQWWVLPRFSSAAAVCRNRRKLIASPVTTLGRLIDHDADPQADAALSAEVNGAN